MESNTKTSTRKTSPTKNVSKKKAPVKKATPDKPATSTKKASATKKGSAKKPKSVPIYVDADVVRKKFAEHLMEHCYYSESDAAFAVSDFPDSYGNCYLFEEYVSICMIDGKKYECRATYTHLASIGIFAPDFKFYTYYCLDDMQGHSVGEYRKARKLYQVTKLDKDDFPKFVNN